MPRYSSRQAAQRFTPLSSAHRQTVFLRNISEDQFKGLQSIASSAVDASVHPEAFADFAKGTRDQLIYALWQEHDAKHKRGEKTGGGLSDALHWVAKAGWEPIQEAWNLARNSYHFFTHDNTISEHTRLTARAIQQTYNPDIDERVSTLGDYSRVPEFSTDWCDLWRNEATKQMLLTVRGSRDAEDFLVDDARILSGAGPRDLVSDEIRSVFKKFDKEYDIECSGHSLGASLLALSLSNNDQLDPTKISFFNPGTSPIPLVKDAVNEFSQNDNAYYFMNAIDPVSAGQLTENPQHLILNGPVSWINPVKNHTLDQWIDQGK